MNTASKMIRIFLVVVVATLIMGRQAQAGVSCHKINAKGEGQGAPPPAGFEAGTVATIKGGGLLQGTTNAGFNFTSPPNPAGFEGFITFITNKATLTVDIAGTFDVLSGDFYAEGPVSDATGKLAGATGFLVFEGVQDLGSVTGEFVETVTGEICVDLAP